MEDAESAMSYFSNIEIAMALSAFMRTVEGFRGARYRWGGDDPSGFDCSGLVVEGLKAADQIGETEDYTADSLYHKYFAKLVPKPHRGCLIFRLNKQGKAVHVGICEDQLYYLAAEGGGPHIKTDEDADKYNAFIKTRPIRKIKNPRFVDPWKD